MHSRQSAVSFAGERGASLRDRGRIDAGARGKREKETLVAEHMLQYSDKKAGAPRGATDLLNCKPARLEEAGQPLWLLANKGKRLNRQHFCRIFVQP